MKFEPKHTDYIRSPYTGLTREDWLDAAQYMLNGIFSHITDMKHPIVVPRKETEITYPHKHAKGEQLETEKKAEIFEGLTRSLFIAAPVIHNIPDFTLHGLNLAQYYKYQILCSCTSGNEYCAGTYEELQELTGDTDSFRAFQQTCETCALVIGLWASREEIWDTYTKQEKDIIANFLKSYAENSTVPQNWRLFNMLDLAFLYREGYEIDEAIMIDHAQSILDYYVGDGWYRDGQSFDYYSCWAFNFYAPLWNEWYGYEKLPYLAEQFEYNSNQLMKSYPDFFDRDGFTNMWGRSCIYRFASVSPFDGNYFVKNPTVKAGVARRICSGSLLQFLGREDFLWNGLPTLGFYGQFAPLVQGYSCAESVFWMGKAFCCLLMPADHEFWTAKESLGDWEKLDKGEVKETVLNGPGLCTTNHEATGETILRSGKIVKQKEDIHGMWNYSKLCYNTKYPWESTPIPGNTHGARAADIGEIESLQYVMRDGTDQTISRCNATYWCGSHEGVLYRRQFFDLSTEIEMHWRQGILLADFPVAKGIMRVDKVKLHRRPVRLTLGSYGFPDNGTKVEQRESGGARAIILTGTDATGRKKKMAMTIYSGWQKLDVIYSKGTNPDSEQSIIAYAVCEWKRQYDGTESYALISQIITKEDDVDFTEDELFPISNVEFQDEAKRGAYGPITLHMRDETIKIIDYNQIEGRMTR